MSPVRPLRRDDLPQVAALFESRLSGVRRTHSGIVEGFNRQFLEAPTTDPAIPSLVATDGSGRVIGFLGASVIPMVLDGQPVRAVATGPLFTRPDAQMVAVFLLRGLLSGPQALTFSDRQSIDAHRLFAKLGARAVHPRCVWWEVPLLKAEYFVLHSMSRRRAALKNLLHPMARLVDRVYQRRWRPSHETDGLISEPLTPELVAAALPEITGWARLRPAYEEDFVKWRFTQLRRARSMGTLRALAVRDERVGLMGWCIVMVPKGGIATVLQLVARHGSESAVIRCILRVAASGGAVAVRGRLEPEVAFALRGFSGVLSQRNCLLVQSNNDDVWQALNSHQTVLTLLDGEPQRITEGTG